MSTLFLSHTHTVEPLPTAHTRNPHKHWKVLLGIFFCSIFGLMILSFYLLFQIRNEQVFQVKPTLTDTPTVLKDDVLKKVMDSFGQKDINRKALIDHPLTYSDPSL